MPPAPSPFDLLGLVLAAALAGVAVGWGTRWAGALVAHPWRVLAALALPTLGALLGLVRLDPLGIALSLDASTQPLLPRGDAQQEVHRRAVRDFGDDQVFVVAMETDDVFTREHLTALARVGDRISRLDGVRRVTSLSRVTSFRYAPDRDWVDVRPLIDVVPQDADTLRVLRERVLGDPLYRRTLVSDDGRAAALNVTFRAMSDGDFIAADLDGAIRAIVDAETTPGRRFAITGRPHIKSVMHHAMVRDLAILIPVCFLVIAAALFGMTGSLRAVAVALGNVAVAILWTFGVMAWLAQPLTVLSVLLAPMLIAIGSVYGVHVVSRTEEEEARTEDRPEAVRTALLRLRLPVGIAGATTAVGFGALMLSDVPAVFEVGAYAVVGVASITILTLLGVPAVLVLWPRASRSTQHPRATTALDRTLQGLAELSRRHRALVLGGWALLAGLALLGLPRIVVDTDYLSFFDADAPVRVDFARVDAHLAGAVPLFLRLDAGEPGRLREPEVLRAIERLEQRLEALPEVGRVLSFLGPLRALNRALSEGDPQEERIPETRGAVSELLFLLPKSDLQPFLTVDHSVANLILRTGAVGSASLRDLSSRIEAIVADERPAGLEVALTGNALLLTRAADGVARGQLRSVGASALVIFALLASALRSVRLGLVAMVPNALPVLLFFGALGAGVAPLSLPTGLVGCVALGIAIDATAHYLIRYGEERRGGASREEATLRCNRTVGRPIAIASVVLAVGFASVMASSFVTLREFGLLTAGTLIACALTDLTLLPALLLRSRDSPRRV